MDFKGDRYHNPKGLCAQMAPVAPHQARLHPQPTPTRLDISVLRRTLEAARARPQTMLDNLAVLCKQAISPARRSSVRYRLGVSPARSTMTAEPQLWLSVAARDWVF
jgi:hypothetical protein